MRTVLLYKALFKALFILMAATTCVVGVNAGAAEAPAGKAYTVKKGDWLRRVAKMQLGDSAAFRQIIEATNAKAGEDNRFIPISEAQPLDVGQMIWIPQSGDASQVEATKPKVVAAPRVSTATSAPAVVSMTSSSQSSGQSSSKAKVLLPITNCEIQHWYNYQVVAIPVVNNRWADAGLTLAERAERAYALRYNARANARYLMLDKAQAEALRQQNQAKYGYLNGPTFSYQVSKAMSAGLEGDDIYRSIIKIASRPDPIFNGRCD